MRRTPERRRRSTTRAPIGKVGSGCHSAPFRHAAEDVPQPPVGHVRHPINDIASREVGLLVELWVVFGWVGVGAEGSPVLPPRVRVRWDVQRANDVNGGALVLRGDYLREMYIYMRRVRSRRTTRALQNKPCGVLATNVRLVQGPALGEKLVSSSPDDTNSLPNPGRLSPRP